jgi:hypothetical protein
MDTTMKNMSTPFQESAFRRWWKSRTFLQQRMIRMCMSLLVMILCFPLYYSGFFGTVDGPLHPSRIGDMLAGAGFTRVHFTAFFLLILIVALTWNWIYNLVCAAFGRRLTCKRVVDDEGTVCGAAVQRSQATDRKTGRKSALYVCACNHKRPDAHFHPVKKGTLAHAAWAVVLACAVIVLLS